MEIDEKELEELRRKAGLWEKVEEIAKTQNCDVCSVVHYCLGKKHDNVCDEATRIMRIVENALKETP